jgi:steroid delta-isomerase-like uncharacterized protein
MNTTQPSSLPRIVEERLDVVRAHFSAFNAHDEQAALVTISDAFFNHEAAGTERESGPDGFRGTFQMLTAAFPDLSYELQELLPADPDRVVARCRMSGTHDGPFRGLAPTGKSFAADHIHIFRIAKRQIIEHWAVRDDLAMMRQLGRVD